VAQPASAATAANINALRERLAANATAGRDVNRRSIGKGFQHTGTE
jgi:hypothetical protein